MSRADDRLALSRLVICRIVALLAALVCLLAAAPADGRQSRKKAIWGPLTVGSGKSQFPIYRDLGVGIYPDDPRWNAGGPETPGDPAGPPQARTTTGPSTSTGP